MGNFHLKIRDDGGKAERVVELHDGDASSALQALFWRKSDRQAELWNADRLICTVKRIGAGGDLWCVAPAG